MLNRRTGPVTGRDPQGPAAEAPCPQASAAEDQAAQEASVDDEGWGPNIQELTRQGLKRKCPDNMARYEKAHIRFRTVAANRRKRIRPCPLYPSDAADELTRGDLECSSRARKT